MAVVLERKVNKFIFIRTGILCFLDVMIWKDNTLKEVVAVVLYKSRLSALHDNDLIHLDPDWLVPTLLGAAAVNSYQ